MLKRTHRLPAYLTKAIYAFGDSQFELGEWGEDLGEESGILYADVCAQESKSRRLLQAAIRRYALELATK